jgi:Mn2+/Fe2+ NRAMP family transporter
MSKRVPANLADPALLPTWLPLAIRKYPVKRLLVPGKVSVFVVGFGAASLISILFVPYSTYVKYLKWLTLSLFAYVGVTLFVHVSWGNVARATLIPHVQLTKESLTALAAPFYAVICTATILGLSLNFLHIDPVKALFWAAVVNGLVSAPLMAVIMTIASSQKVMGKFVIGPYLRSVGWIATAVMSCVGAGVFLTWR